MKNIYIKYLICIGLFIGQLPVYSQTNIVKGKITDGKEPLVGATLSLPSGKEGTSTDSEGKFTLKAKKGDKVTISMTGFETKSFTIKSEVIDITLQPIVTNLSDVVVIGSRRGGRVKTESAVPIDIININQAANFSAKPDVTALLNMTTPSLNYNKQSGSDGADAIDLATLRGLGPDQTLVLVNGKRRHQTAFVAVFGTRGRGNSGTDLNAIPISAIERVEVLRDGASAQYGSDAIAGVINIILKKTVNEWQFTAGESGYYDHTYNVTNNVDYRQYPHNDRVDGVTYNAGANYGLPIGKNGGFVNFTGNFLSQGKTMRQAPDTNYSTNPQALPFNGVRRALGDASLLSGGGMFNMEIPVSNTKTTFYAFGGYNYKNSNAYAYSRNFSQRPDRFPTDANGNLIFVPGIMQTVIPGTQPSQVTASNDIYYNPEEEVHISDISLSAGIKGTNKHGWDWNFSNTLGRNDFHYYGEKTFNASLGAAGINKNSFDDGGFNLLVNTLDLDFSKRFTNIANGLNLSYGAEYRAERYSIYQGEEASYKNYDPTKATGAQGFPGFQPSDEVKTDRTNLGAYVEGELDITKKWLADAAVRFENYNDFGFLTTFKLASRYKVAQDFNIRGSVSTGYRAPSLAQINFSNTFTNVQGGKVFEVKIAPNYSPITKAAGIPNLKQETSTNASLGFSWKPEKSLTITVDGYRVEIKDRVVLTGAFDTTNAALKPILNQLNVAQAQFFANAVNTTNYGVDVVLDYNKRLANDQHIKATLAANYQNMTIDKINIPDQLSSSPSSFYSTREQKFILASAPPFKGSLGLEYGVKKISVGTHLTYYGKITLEGYSGSVPLDANPSVTVPENFVYTGKMVTDIYVSYKLFKKSSVTVGADNLFNVHPDLGIVKGANSQAYDGEAGGAWDPVQMGYNGLRVFTKFAISL